MTTVSFRFPWFACLPLLLLAFPLRVSFSDLRAQDLLRRADAQRAQFLFDEALALERQAARVSPEDAALQLHLAETIRTLWLFRDDASLQQGADAAFARAGTLSPHWALPHYEHARMYGGKGQYARALDLLAPALKLDPNNAGYWLERARYLKALEQTAEARAAFARCAALLPPQYEPECDRGAQP